MYKKAPKVYIHQSLFKSLHTFNNETFKVTHVLLIGLPWSFIKLIRMRIHTKSDWKYETISYSYTIVLLTAHYG